MITACHGQSCRSLAEHLATDKWICALEHEGDCGATKWVVAPVTQEEVRGLSNV